ncbi:sugar kinase, ribokinase [Sphaerochaeta pleomorpha str. Grapes]|uniref:Ribokinase n=1 Tax=Sphaerochaeta pleomorpha (strain ATCC BAA-1885 / DSM 22778 / Grapes) TaxID=158190 RepID=G8QXI0_SPHPG|nr:ribokinase [Sphaerochaeta pleomorpha]AEV29543.1 sugar kinase, ribokinase [Sphaerochaeta pleomorpha str. Grapes]
MEKIAVIGSYVADIMARTPHIPALGETVKGSFFRIGAGGKGFNQAIAAAKSGNIPLFVTKIGDDHFGAMALQMLQENGIDPADSIVDPAEDTGIALISVDEQSGQNEIIVVPGASGTFTKKDTAKIAACLAGFSYLLVQLEINIEATLDLVEQAKEMCIKTILNPAPVQEIPDSLYKGLFLISPNEVEAQQLSGLPYRSDADCTPIAEFFFSKGVQNVVITLGKRGAYLNTGKDEYFIDNYKVPVVDTTGAGDAFNGGLLSGLSKGMDLVNAFNYANVVANLSITKTGTSNAMPNKQDIDRFLLEHAIVL